MACRRSFGERGTFEGIRVLGARERALSGETRLTAYAESC